MPFVTPREKYCCLNNNTRRKGKGCWPCCQELHSESARDGRYGYFHYEYRVTWDEKILFLMEISHTHWFAIKTQLYVESLKSLDDFFPVFF